MENINSKFNEELQQQIEGTLPKGHIYSLGYPGEKLLSAGLPNLPIELKAEKIADKADPNYKSNHPFNLLEIINLPEAINNPITVFNSTKNDRAKVILTELKDKNGNNFVVVIKVYMSPSSRKNSIAINNIISLYPKNNVTDLINWFKSGDKLIAWLDKKKALDFVSTQSPNAIVSGNKEGLIINIVNNFENVK